MAEPQRLVVASANPDKVREIESILAASLGDAWILLPRPPEIPDIDETGFTLEENARIKAEAIRDATGISAVADDTGLEVDALDGAPGVYSARYAGPQANYKDNVTKLLAELSGNDNRSATFRTVALVAFADGSELAVEGQLRGVIAGEAKGSGGFGYDSVFVPEGGDGRSYAEMSDVEKNAISHRGRALRNLAQELADRD